MSEQTMTAGTYLRKRREAAGLTIADISSGYATGAERDAFAAQLDAFEKDRDVAGPATLARMREIYRFAAPVYRDLAAGLPAGAICRSCACTWHDPCLSKAGNCFWSANDLCSACTARSACPNPTAQEPTFVLHAGDPHAVAMMAILSYLRLGERAHARRALEDAIRDDERRAGRVGIIPAEIDEKGGQDAAALALDMIAWRTVDARTIAAGDLAHV